MKPPQHHEGIGFLSGLADKLAPQLLKSKLKLTGVDVKFRYLFICAPSMHLKAFRPVQHICVYLMQCKQCRTISRTMKHADETCARLALPSACTSGTTPQHKPTSWPGYMSGRAHAGQRCCSQQAAWLICLQQQRFHATGPSGNSPPEVGTALRLFARLCGGKQSKGQGEACRGHGGSRTGLQTAAAQC